MLSYWSAMRIMAAFIVSLGPATPAAIKGSIYWEKRGAGNIVFSVPVTEKRVALTFDDGPSPVYTPQILSILKANHAKATFFVVGKWVNRYQNITKEEHNQGHEVGNHTEHHPQMSLVTTEEITQCDHEVHQAIGLVPKLVRPPGGHLNDHFLHIAKGTHHTIIMWSWDVDSKDWSKPGVQKIVSAVIDHVSPGDIIILHDGGGLRKQTVAALPIILHKLKEQHYECVTVTELLHTTMRSANHQLPMSKP